MDTSVKRLFKSEDCSVTAMDQIASQQQRSLTGLHLIEEEAAVSLSIEHWALIILALRPA